MNKNISEKKIVNYCRQILGWLEEDVDRAGLLLPGDIEVASTAQAYFSLINQALNAGVLGNARGVVAAIEKTFTLAEWPVPNIVSLWIQALGLTGQQDRIPEICRITAERAAAEGNHNLCIDACHNLLIEDLRYRMEWVNSPQRLQQIAKHYEAACASLSLPPVRIRPPAGKIRIGLVIPGLPSFAPPFARRALHFARYLDSDRYELFVYSTEGLRQCVAAMPSRWLGGASLPAGQSSLDQLLELGANVHFVVPEGFVLQRAASLAMKMAEDRLDAVIIQSGLIVPIDWLAVRMAPVPVKLHIHIGIPNYLPDSDYTLFDNAANLNREKAQWPSGAGKPILLRRGTDLKAMDAVPSGKRETYGIPEEAVVVGALSNNFNSRFSAQYAAVLCEAMLECPEMWFVPVGSGRLPSSVTRQFVEAGVADRVRHISHTFEPARELKLMDIYASEFPQGGSQAVVEALVCSLPVVAMRCGDTHYESISADVAGPMAIDGNRPNAYRDRIVELVRNRELRQQEAVRARHRAETCFSIEKYVQSTAQLAETILRRKCGEDVDEGELIEQWGDAGCDA